ncbi:MAG TPA: hypothetical protein CFH82_10385 [Sulfurospirillum sp. UBA12182]|jgi:hypothetical protein|nr:MAG TPA: hypothetical protein CFH82_10385 [Sulfurospirillum sp. UBA12182]
MKKMMIFMLLLPFYLYAHTLVLSVFDNGDDTINIKGMFNTGESAAGAMVRLEALSSHEVLFEQRLSDESELVTKIPEVPYIIILDGGPGHSTKHEGIPPKEGFKQEVKKQVKAKKPQEKPNRMSMKLSSSVAVNVSILIAFILLFATIFVSVRNTNKLLLAIKESQKE